MSLTDRTKEFLNSINTFTGLSGLEEVFHGLVQDHGFEGEAYFRLYSGGRTFPRTLLFGRCPPQAATSRDCGDYARRDPATALAFRTTSAFTWDEAAAATASPAAAEAVKEARRLVSADGLVTPVRSGLDELGVCLLYAPEKIIVCAYERLLLQGLCTAYSRRGLELLKGETEETAPALTGREAECLQLVASGHSDQEIATALGRSFNTVHTHVESLRSKLKARSRAQLVLRATMSGLLPVDDPPASARPAPAPAGG